MSWIQGVVLGLVQGLTEFFPVSSSGHLILTPVLFGWKDQGAAFDTVLHLGTLAALLFYFRKAFFDSFKRAQSSQVVAKRSWHFLILVIFATVPTLVLAASFHDSIEHVARHARLVAFDLAFWGLVLFAVDHFWPKPPEQVDDNDWEVLEKITFKQALIVGLAQPLSLFPGTSRSGITMTAGMLAGLSRATAARFSFFLSIPVTGAAGAYGLYSLIKHGLGDVSMMSLFFGFIVSFLVGVWAIRFLVSYVSKKRFDLFVVYRLALALLVLWLV
jgi:undecaprenyl-diphosphatase